MKSNPVLKFQLLSSDVRLPQYAHDTDAGFDIFALEGAVLAPGARNLFKTGLSSQIPQGWYVQFFDKSSVAAKLGLHVLGGVIDSAYRGEWGVVLYNLSGEEVVIEKGDKIVQGILLPITQPEIVQVEELEDSDRGTGGFGSTGRK